MFASGLHPPKMRQGTSANNVVVAAQVVAIIEPLADNTTIQDEEGQQSLHPAGLDDDATCSSFENSGYQQPMQPPPTQPSLDRDEDSETFKKLAYYIATRATFSQEQRWKIKEAESATDSSGAAAPTTGAQQGSRDEGIRAGAQQREEEVGENPHEEGGEEKEPAISSPNPLPDGDEGPNTSGDTLAGAPVGVAEVHPHLLEWESGIQQSSGSSPRNLSPSLLPCTAPSYPGSTPQSSQPPLHILRVQLIHFS
jgi:hypothetical protein